MAYVIGLGGLAGVALLAYVLIERRYIHPRWRRWPLGVLGFSLTALLWIVHPILTHAPQDGSSLADQWP